MSYQVVFRGFDTKQQAEAFAKWYERQGEQDACPWFEEMCAQGTLDVDSMLVNMQETFPLEWEGGELPVVLKMNRVCECESPEPNLSRLELIEQAAAARRSTIIWTKT